MDNTVECQNLNRPNGQLSLPLYAGILAGKELLDSMPSSHAFMVLITDGDHNGAGDLAATAAEARADNVTTIFAVGVGATQRKNVFFSDRAPFDPSQLPLDGYRLPYPIP